MGFELAGICALELSSREAGDENPGKPEASPWTIDVYAMIKSWEVAVETSTSNSRE